MGSRSWADVLAEHSPPLYLIDRSRGTIRVFHGDLDETYWKRGDSPGEYDVRRVADIIRAATGLRQIKRRHDRYVVELILRKELFDQAATALRMSFKCVADQDEAVRKLLEYRREK